MFEDWSIIMMVEGQARILFQPARLNIHKHTKLCKTSDPPPQCWSSNKFGRKNVKTKRRKIFKYLLEADKYLAALAAVDWLENHCRLEHLGNTSLAFAEKLSWVSMRR